MLLYHIFLDVNECLKIECLNNATCVNRDGSYQCDCLPGYTGQLCEEGKYYYIPSLFFHLNKNINCESHENHSEIILTEYKAYFLAGIIRGVVKEDYMVIILFQEKIHFGYSNEYPQDRFYGELQKIIPELPSNTCDVLPYNIDMKLYLLEMI